MAKKKYINVGNHRIEIEKHDNGAISICDPNAEPDNCSFSYEEKSNGSHVDAVKEHLSDFVSAAAKEVEQTGIDFIDRQEASESES